MLCFFCGQCLFDIYAIFTRALFFIFPPRGWMDSQVAPDEFVEKYEKFQRLKKIRSIVEAGKGVAKAIAAKEKALEF